MAGVKLGVVSAGDGKLKRLRAVLRSGAPAAMKAAAAAMVTEVTMSFREQRDPDGKPWAAPHSPVTLELRARGGLKAGKPGERKRPSKRQAQKLRTNARLLIDKGTLLRSISPQSTNKTASVTTNVPYAAVHQFGNPDNRLGENPAPIPARRFMPLDAAGKVALPARLKAEIVAMVRDEIMNRVNGGG